MLKQANLVVGKKEKSVRATLLADLQKELVKIHQRLQKK
jgi:hypothetical protein